MNTLYISIENVMKKINVQMEQNMIHLVENVNVIINGIMILKTL